METQPPETSATEAVERILAAAERLFGERGFNGVSTRLIADAAGVSKANVFHHFTSKLALYEAVLSRGAERFKALLLQLTTDDRPLPELLEDFSLQHLQNMFEHAGTFSLFLRQLLDTGAGAERTLIENVLEQSFDLLVDSFATLKAQGRLADGIEPRTLALTLVGSHLSFFLLRSMLAQRGELDDLEDSVDTFSRQVVDQLIGGIAPAASASRNHEK